MDLIDKKDDKMDSDGQKDDNMDLDDKKDDDKKDDEKKDDDKKDTKPPGPRDRTPDEIRALSDLPSKDIYSTAKSLNLAVDVFHINVEVGTLACVMFDDNESNLSPASRRRRHTSACASRCCFQTSSHSPYRAY